MDVSFYSYYYADSEDEAAIYVNGNKKPFLIRTKGDAFGEESYFKAPNARGCYGAFYYIVKHMIGVSIADVKCNICNIDAVERRYFIEAATSPAMNKWSKKPLKQISLGFNSVVFCADLETDRGFLFANLEEWKCVSCYESSCSEEVFGAFCFLVEHELKLNVARCKVTDEGYTWLARHNLSSYFNSKQVENWSKETY